MAAYVSKTDLLKKRVAVEEDVEIPGLGTVKVRAMTRAEALALYDKEMSLAVADRKLLATAMVEPKLTEEEVAELQATTPAGLLQPVINTIETLSGIKEKETVKEAVTQFRD